MTVKPTLRTTPLDAAHRALGGRMVEFAGTSLPVQYRGVIAESKAVREGVGMFDVSHMARLALTGERALDFLEWATTNDVAKLGDGQGQYSLLPNAAGGTVDDVVVYRRTPGDYRMVVNAANREKDLAHLRGLDSMGVEILDATDRTAMIAVQGPRAAATVAAVGDRGSEAQALCAFGTLDMAVAGVPCYVARSGYTGEDGFELQCPAEGAGRVWQALLDAGVEPCGLGARDTLRVEAGLPLYGHELTDDLSPIAAGLGWVVSKTKEFLGSERINRTREEGTPVKLQGIRLESKRVAQPGSAVIVAGSRAGAVSSGVYSPTLDCGIALAFLDADIKLGSPCEVEFRGRAEPGTVVGKRFYRRG